jgi:hypothetical protein
MSIPVHPSTYIPSHPAPNHTKTHHLGTITTVTTTPPSITILPSNGSHPLTSLTLSQKELRTILHNLSAGAAEVSYTIRYYLHGTFAADVKSIGMVDGDDEGRGGAAWQERLGWGVVVPSQGEGWRMRGRVRVRSGWRRREWGA